MKKCAFLIVLFLCTTLSAVQVENVNPQPRGVRPWSLDLGNSVVVDPCLDDPNEKYDWLASSDRNSRMGVLSATNRRVVILAPGTHTLTASLIMDTNFVDMSVMVSHGWDTTYLTTNLTGKDCGTSTVILQTANDIRLSGFTVQNTATGGITTRGALILDAANNDPSVYQNMQFLTNRVDGYGATSAVNTRNTGSPTTRSFKGTWINCRANPDTGHGFRFYGTGTYDPTMWDCVAGDKSFIGTYTADGPIAGKHYRCIGEDRSFGSNMDTSISSDALFVDCIGGDGSFGTEANTFGTYLNCTAGANSFGGHWDNFNQGDGYFRGYAEGCTATQNSFGDDGAGFVSGEIVDCKITGREVPMRLKQGALIRNSRIEVTANNIDAITLLDSNTKIYNTIIDVDDTGTGIPITASESQSLIAVGCTMNNKDNDADGLGSNVSNAFFGTLIFTGYPEEVSYENESVFYENEVVICY